MGQTIGIWGNYQNGKFFEIDEHERWLRAGSNSEKLGLSKASVDDFKEFKPTEDRDAFLLEMIMRNPIMRCRQHGTYSTFEFNSFRIEKPMELIIKIGEYLGFGPYSGLYIVNHYGNQSASITWMDFKKKMQWADSMKDLQESFESFVPLKLGKTVNEALSCKKMNAKEYKNSGAIGSNDKFKKLNESYGTNIHLPDMYHDFEDEELEDKKSGRAFRVDFTASYDYTPEEAQTRDYPGCPESLDFNKLESVDKIIEYDEDGNDMIIDMKNINQDDLKLVRGLCEEMASDYECESRILQHEKDSRADDFIDDRYDQDYNF